MISSEYKSFANDIACELFGFGKKKEESKTNKDVKTPKAPEYYECKSIPGYKSAESYIQKNFALLQKKAMNAASKMLPRFDSAFFKELYEDDYEEKYSSPKQIQNAYKPITRAHLISECVTFPWINTETNEWCAAVYVSPDVEYEKIFDELLHIDPQDEDYSCFFSYVYEIDTGKEYIWRGGDSGRRIISYRLTKSEYEKFMNKNNPDQAMEFFNFMKKKEPEKKESKDIKHEPYKASAKEINEARKELIDTYSDSWNDYEKGNLMKFLKGVEFLKFIDAEKYNDPELDTEIHFHFEITPKAQEIINKNGKEILVGAKNCWIIYIPGEGWESTYEDNQ